MTGQPAIATSSKPTTQVSSGTRTPSTARALSAPNAMRSFAQNTERGTPWEAMCARTACWAVSAL